MSYNSKPNINNSDVDLSKLGGDFISRMENHKTKIGKKIIDIKSAIEDPNEKELTFKPKISNDAKVLKRDVNDLFVIY